MAIFQQSFTLKKKLKEKTVKDGVRITLLGKLNVADEADLASAMMEEQMARALSKASNLTIPTNDTGKCLYCAEPVEHGRRWCNADCRELFEHEQRKN